VHRFNFPRLAVVLVTAIVGFGACAQGPGTPGPRERQGPTEPPDTAPAFAVTVADQTYTEGVAISPLVLLEASGGNGALSYSLTPTVPGLTFTAATRTLSGTPTSAGPYAMIYQVVDGDTNTAASDAATLTFTITVQESEPPDTAPAFAVPLIDQTYTEGVAISPLVLPEASGGNGILSYSLTPTVPGLTFVAATRTLRGTPTSAGPYAMTYQVIDGDTNTAASDAATLTFTITVQEPEPPDTAPPDTAPASAVIATPTVSDSAPAAKATFILTVSVQSDGNGAAVTLNIYRSTDGTITRSDTLVDTVVAELDTSGNGSQSARMAATTASGTSYFGEVELTAPDTAGTYYYGACEADTEDNCSTSVQVQVTESEDTPDLMVESVSVSDSEPSPGGTFTLSATVRNAGTGAAVATTVRFYRSAGTSITASDTEVDDATVVALAASGSVTESADLTAPQASGNYYYGACVDAVSDESDATNNCSTAVLVQVVRDPAGGFTLGPKPTNLGPNSDYQPNEDGWHIGTEGVDVLLVPDGIDAKVDVRGGDDRVFGGNGNDHFIGGADNDILSGGPGADYLVGGPGDDQLLGNDGADHLVGGEGMDRLIDGPGENSDRFEGGPGDDYIGGNAGIDYLYGGDDDDHLNDPFGANEMYGGPGNDRLYGTGKLDGGEGDDYLQSSATDGNQLYGGAGRDELWAGGGDHSFWGGADGDTFDFNYPGSANVTIKDFVPGEDLIDLGTLFRISGFGDLTITASGDDVVIELTEHYSGTIRIEDVAVGDLDADDFRF